MYKIEFRSISLLGVIFLFLFSCSFKNSNLSSKNDTVKKTENFKRAQIVKTAESLIGVRYRSGGKNTKGFDCSGFTGYVYDQLDIDVKGPSKTQAKLGKIVEVSKAKPGDIMVFGPAFRINHVGIVTENKKGRLMVVHSTSSQGVVKHNIYKNSYWKKRMKFARDVISP